ncbi:O-antigen ligase family protein [Clostridium thermobutyricum]|uniref:O-antigen ligase family protein n=1 Tax=Clostridium thermobutyricum TaxID=29372 RepID=UPI003F521986
MRCIIGIKEKFLELNKRKFDNAEVINILLHMILCVMPLILSSKGTDRYYYPKALFLYGIGILIFILMIKEITKLNTETDKIFILFFGLLVLSTINSMDISRSITGGTWRYEGIITLFMYGIIFIAASKDFKLSKLGINLFLFSGLIVAIYYIIQNLGYEPLNFLLKNAEKMNSTIGNRNFLSSYLLIFLALSMCGFIFYKNKKCFIYSLVYFLALIYSKTRGGWVSLGIFSLLGLYFIIKDRNRLKRAIIIVISFTLIFFVVNLFNSGEFMERLETVKEDAINIKDSSAGSGRVGIYKGAINMIKERPFLGTGVSCFWEGFQLDAPKDVLDSWKSQNIMVDKAHNEILNYAATSGVPAAILYIILIFLVFYRLWKNKEDDRVRTILIILFGYVVQANLNISVVPVAPLFWIILGIGSNIEIIKNLKMEDKEKNVIM